MTKNEEIDLEIRNQAVRLSRSVALFELPMMVYAQIMADNDTRARRPTE